jgi:hypothetical protein
VVTGLLEGSGRKVGILDFGFLHTEYIRRFACEPFDYLIDPDSDRVCIEGGDFHDLDPFTVIE